MPANYFTLFDLPEGFALDIGALEKSYFSLQLQWHPDRFITKPSEERMHAMQRSVEINDAYHTLKDPYARAKYLLALQGIHVGGERDAIAPDAALLMESMEQREALEACDHIEQVQSLLQTQRAQLAQCMVTLETLFADNAWMQAAQHTLRLAYLQKFQQELNVAAKRLSARDKEASQ